MNSKARSQRAQGTVYSLSAALMAGFLALLMWKLEHTGGSAETTSADMAILVITSALAVCCLPVLWMSDRAPAWVRNSAVAALTLAAASLVGDGVVLAFRYRSGLSISFVFAFVCIAAFLAGVVIRIITSSRIRGEMSS
ncbi:hypothetical protein [Nocardia suismassiliense]|uniref:hypothetical protein n=1 Tax=Nocardia suismassiliense TaxID=2077092 RepID=UPI000D1D657A|nr:hypothetical protein [Nocardia suismassiliense]